MSIWLFGALKRADWKPIEIRVILIAMELGMIVLRE